MLQSIAIKNFQSLHDVSLDLTRFTVIVGPSSSGKSAFTRALHTLVHNRRGLDFLTHGERLMTITATTERGTVVLSRGKSTADNSYVVIPTDDPSNQQKWSKLDGKVPEDVSRFLGLYPGSHSFAAQHDKPYLLDTSGPSNAAVLGKLTNVHVIFEAAREAKRQALDASKTLKLRSEDLAKVEEQLPRYEHIDGQRANLELAEQKILTAYQLQRSINSITSAKESLVVAAGAVKRLKSAADVTPPDLSRALELYKQLTALSSLKQQLTGIATEYRAAQQAMATAAEEQAAIDNERVDLHENISQVFEAAFRAPGYGPDIPIEFAAPIAATTVQELSA